MASTTSSIRRSVQEVSKRPKLPKAPRAPFSPGYDSGEVPSPTVRKVMPNLGTIQLLLHLYVTGEDWEITSRTSQTDKNAYTFLRNNGMVDSVASVTKKGEVWIDFLKKIPLPIESYRVPTYKLHDDPDAV